ncbi:hypothetical protein KAJ27_01985 [bacterium]|nr:hypothetical protein [bacterium]
MKKIFVVLIVFTFLVAVGFTKDFKTLRDDPGIKIYETAQTFSMYYEEIPGRPFLVIHKLPKFNRQHSKHLLMGNLPFRLKLDYNVDGITDARISPFVKFNEILTDGVLLELTQRGYVEPAPMRMCEFDRLEFKLHCGVAGPKPCIHTQRKFKFNRIVIRRQRDGNIMVTLRDLVFNTGLDEVFETDFIW